MEIPLSRPDITEAEIEAVCEVLRTPNLSLGPKLGEFEQAKLVASDGAAWDYFGVSVSISGDYAIVGAYYDGDKGTNSGSAYIFKRDGTSWPEQAKLTASDGAAWDNFGVSVSISGDYALVGTYGDYSESAYIFNRDGTSWPEQEKLLASDSAAEDYFGFSVSISSDYVIVGAWKDDDNEENSGSAYIFEKVLCPDSDLTGDCCVDSNDINVLSGLWLFNELSLDLYPAVGDGVVNFPDWAVFAQGWLTTYDIADCAEFAEQWLLTGARYCVADIAPQPDGDGRVNMLDFAELAGQWLYGSE